MLIFPSAVWQCNVVYLADKLIFFGGNEWGGEWGVLPQPVADSRMFNKCVTFLCGGMEAIGERRLANGWGACYAVGHEEMPCVRIPLEDPYHPSPFFVRNDSGPLRLFALCTRVWNWFLCCDYIFEKVGRRSEIREAGGCMRIYVFMYEVYMGQPARTHSATAPATPPSACLFSNNEVSPQSREHAWKNIN